MNSLKHLGIVKYSWSFLWHISLALLCKIQLVFQLLFTLILSRDGSHLEEILSLHQMNLSNRLPPRGYFRSSA
jgi:hypothetical protein